MIEHVRQSPADERGGDVFIALEGRDPARTHRIMGELWSHATKINLEPLRWKLGFFNLRDVIKARDPHSSDRDYDRVRLETLWGCTIDVVSLFDTIELVAVDHRDGHKNLTTLIPGEK
jgi:hypothetical protein